MTAPYTFTSERLGFRNWQEKDIADLAAMNADPKVMEYFPSVASMEQSRLFLNRMHAQFSEKGFCYFAVEKLIDQSFIGFIGLSEQNFKASFTPCIDIGWRIQSSEWKQGFAVEGAKKCLEYGFNVLGIPEIVSIAPLVNINSVKVMERIGMHKSLEFDHPLLLEYNHLKKCVLYRKNSIHTEL